MVVLRLNLDEIEADEIQIPEPAHEPQRIAATRPPDFWRAGARGEAGVDEVDVETDKDRTGPDPREHLRQDLVNTTFEERLRRDQMQAERTSAAPILGTVERTSDAALHRPRRIDQTFFDRAAAPGAVGVALSPIVVPCVRVRVEIDEPDRTMALKDRAELCERDRVVSSYRERNHAGIHDRPEALF